MTARHAHRFGALLARVSTRAPSVRERRPQGERGRRQPSHLRRWGGLAVAAALVATSVAGAAGVQAGDPSFAANAVDSGAQTLCRAASADLNGDGHVDLAVADCAAKKVTVLLGDGSGGFGAAGSPLPVGEDVRSIVATDLNRDAAADLAVLSSGELRLLLGDGKGRFAPAPGFPVRFAQAAAMMAADLNGDGNGDLVVTNRQNNRTRIVPLLGNGTGRFAPAPRTPLAIRDIYASTLAAADFNGDSRRDLAVADWGEIKTVIALGDGAGGFRAARTLRVGLLAVADFNGDARPDLAGTTSVRHRLVTRVLLGKGAGAFRAAAPVVAGPTPAVGAAADFDGDRRIDLAVGSELGISVLLGNGTGKLRHATDSPFPLPAQPFFPAPLPSAIVVDDFTGDKQPDLAATGGRAGLMLLRRTPSAPPAVRGGTLPGPRAAQFSTRGPISRLAVDGNRVAVATKASKGSCGRIVVWTAPRGKAKTFKTRERCDTGTIPYHVIEVAMGGGQVAWIGEGGGNTLEMLMHVAKLSGGRPRQVEYANNSNGAAGDPRGDWIGQFLGGGPLLVYNRWKAVCTVPPDFGCSWTEPTLRVVQQRLFRIAAGRRVVVKRGSGSYPVRAVGGGRMAVEAAGTVTLLGPSGGRVAAVLAVEGNPPRAIALSRTRLAVERTLGLDVHDPASGTKAKSISLGPAAALRLTGVNSRLALLRGPRRLVLVRLSDGKLTSLALASGTATNVVEARLSEAGLFYAYNRPRGATRGRIVFEPTAKLLSRF